MSKSKWAFMVILVVGSILFIAGCGEGSDGDDGQADGADGEDVVLQFGTNLPESHIMAQGYQKMADEVEENSNGRLKIDMYYSDQLGNERDVTESIAQDIGGMAAIGTGEMARRDDTLLIFDAPYVFESLEHMLDFANGEEGQKIWDDFAEETNIRNLGLMYYGARHVTTANTEVHTPEDLNGVSLRVPDQPMPLAYGEALGANATPMELGELYLALQQGVVDGQENPLPTIHGNGFNEVQNNVILTGHVIAATGFVISEEKYQNLPEDLRTILDEAVETAVEDISADVVATEAEILEEFAEQGVNIIEPDLDAFRESSEYIYDEYEDVWGEGLYETIQGVAE
ncbi:DctP family TRAP transporter solute-binding subunit [Oceanobacillus locisalsi]|uniref:DctP family TRAP transporter solute-binding subunit n=1 Tax=Oceanobacillus locisalsi TaxID=546107 RepID=A0ABW3NC86_9BACI